MGFFICILVQEFMIEQLLQNNNVFENIHSYYRTGWVGFGMLFFFNLAFIILGLFDFLLGCKMSNK